MFTEFPLGELLLTPMVVFVTAALGMTMLTRLLIPDAIIRKIVWLRGWLNVSLFVCYLALSMRLFEG